MRVIAGTARGRPISAPPGRGTRPITDRAKEAIFNMLVSLHGVEGAQVLDLYAGSGSFGIECLSRGAADVTFVERDRRAAATIAANLDRLGFTGDRFQIVSAPVEVAVAERAGTGSPAELVFCDPPYADDPWAGLWGLLADLPAEIVVAHAEHDIEPPAPWSVVRRRTYGRSRIVIAEQGAASMSDTGSDGPEH